jgi:hypothetical protein
LTLDKLVCFLFRGRQQGAAGRQDHVTTQEFLFVIATTIAFAQESFFTGLTVGLTAVIASRGLLVVKIMLMFLSHCNDYIE